MEATVILRGPRCWGSEKPDNGYSFVKFEDLFFISMLMSFSQFISELFDVNYAYTITGPICQ